MQACRQVRMHALVGWCVCVCACVSRHACAHPHTHLPHPYTHTHTSDTPNISPPHQITPTNTHTHTHTPVIACICVRRYLRTPPPPPHPPTPPPPLTAECGSYCSTKKIHSRVIGGLGRCFALHSVTYGCMCVCLLKFQTIIAPMIHISPLHSRDPEPYFRSYTASVNSVSLTHTLIHTPLASTPLTNATAPLFTLPTYIIYLYYIDFSLVSVCLLLLPI